MTNHAHRRALGRDSKRLRPGLSCDGGGMKQDVHSDNAGSWRT